MSTLRTTILSLALVAGVAGCTPERHDAIPPDAISVTEGQANISYRPTDDGTIYVYDKTAGKLVYSGDIEAGQYFRVDPGDRRITVDGNVIQDQIVKSGRQYRLFFREKPDERVRETRIERRVVED